MPPDPWPETWPIPVGEFAFVRVLLRLLREKDPDDLFRTLSSLSGDEAQSLLAVVFFDGWLRDEPDPEAGR